MFVLPLTIYTITYIDTNVLNLSGKDYAMILKNPLLKIILSCIILIFFFNPVSAENVFSCPSFDCCTYSWEKDPGAWEYYQVTGGCLNTDTYSGPWSYRINPPGVIEYVYQNVDLTYVSEINFKGHGGTAGSTINVVINGLYHTIGLNSHWNDRTLDVTDHTGISTVAFRNYVGTVYIDDIIGNAISSASITFNPDNEIQNTTISTSIDYHWGDTYPYPTFYVKLWKQLWINNNWSEKVIATQHLIGYPDYCGSPRCWYTYNFWEDVITSPGIKYFPGNEIPCTTNEKCKLTAEIINWANNSIMASDELIYDNEYVYQPPNDSYPEIPDPQPTPTPIYTPFPVITPTPIPTPKIGRAHV